MPLRLPGDVETVVPTHVGITTVEATNDEGLEMDLVRVTVHGHLASDPDAERVLAFVLPPAQVGQVTTQMQTEAARAAGF